jgi:curved DNA-binding protein CbpA/predicted transcriptional regulator
MHGKSVLRAIRCDTKELPIGGLEAFVLSHVDGHTSVEDVAAATGLEVSEMLRIARHLAELGALAADDERGKTKRPSAHQRAARPTTPPHKGAAASLVPPALVPAVRRHPELRSLGLGPREGFVLSQVDGVTSMADLGEITGLSARDLSDALHALEAAGVVELGQSKRRASRSMHASPPVQRPAEVRPASKPPAPTPDSEPCDLPEEERAHITETGQRIEGLDHYAVLGLARDVDAKTIRRAYHALAARYHPDRFYGKKLGRYGKPLERIFVRLTAAYDTLSRKGKRADYDATLPPQPSRPGGHTQKPSVKPQPTHKPPAKTPTRKSLRAMRVPSAPPPRRPPSVVPAPPVPITPAAPAAPVVPPSAPSSSSGSSPDHHLQRLYAEKQRRAVQERIDVFVRAAKEALERDDVVAASHHYGLAVQCSNDPALRAAFEATDAKARVRIRDKSLAGARAAEQAGRWEEAGGKYAKAYGAHAEAWIAERAGNAMRLAKGDLRRAAQLAEQAVLAEPNTAAYRVTLGEIYLDAGLATRAAGEAARALALAPNDPRAKALAKLVGKKKGE